MNSNATTGDALEKRDFIIALLAGLGFTGLYLAFSAHGSNPSLWGDLSVAAGLRPPQTIFPGVWRLLAKGVLSAFGAARALDVLRICGAVFGGGCVCLAYLIVRQTLAALERVQELEEWRPIAPVFSLIAALVLGAGDAMRRVVSPLSPGGIQFFVLLLVLYIFLRWLKKAGRWRILVAMVLSGALAAETPFALLLPLLCYIGYRLTLTAVTNGKFRPDEPLPPPSSFPKWQMFFSFVAGLLVLVSVEISAFVSSDGLQTIGGDMLDLVIRYAFGLGGAVRQVATPIGWGVALAFILLPFAFSLIIFPRLCSDTEPIRFDLGVVLLFAGILSLIQVGVLPFVRLWSVTFCTVLVSSEFLGCILAFCAAFTLALAASCFAESCRNRFENHHGRLLLVERRGFLFRNIVVAVVVLGVSPLALRVYRPVECKLRAVVDEAVAETVRECGDAKILITDGKLDAGLELYAAQTGSKVKPINLFSGGGKWDQYIRTRNFKAGSADYDLAKTGASVLLGVWTGERENGMDDVATQVGFEFWQRSRKPLPKQSGFVAREKGLDDAEAARGVEVANAIAKRIIDVMQNYPNAAISPGVREAIESIAWRISRFARMRDDEQLADALDECNAPVKHMQDRIEYERMRMFMQMTPQEGLRIALRRADFTSARRYGASILKGDPDDPEANFGTGMAYLLMDNKLKEAEFYLERALKRRPEEPAILNNLAMIYFKTDRLQKALEFARRAHELMPTQEEIQKTLRDIERAATNRVEAVGFGDAKPAAEKKPVAEKKPAAEKKSATEKKPTTEKKPAAEKRPATEKKSATEKKPVAEKKPAAEQKSAAEKSE